MHVVIPQIPDESFKKEQQKWLIETYKNFEKNRGEEANLKSLLMKTKSNIFNLQLKHPELKPVYDSAQIMKQTNDSIEKDFLSSKEDLELQRKHSEFKLNKLREYDIEGYQDDISGVDQSALLKEIDILKGKQLHQRSHFYHILFRKS